METDRLDGTDRKLIEGTTEKKSDSIRQEYTFASDVALKECKYCRVMIPKKAKICPNCKMNLRQHVFVKTVAGIVLAAVIVAGSYCLAAYWGIVPDSAVPVWLAERIGQRQFVAVTTVGTSETAAGARAVGTTEVAATVTVEPEPVETEGGKNDGKAAGADGAENGKATETDGTGSGKAAETDNAAGARAAGTDSATGARAAGTDSTSGGKAAGADSAEDEKTTGPGNAGDGKVTGTDRADNKKTAGTDGAEDEKATGTDSAGNKKTAGSDSAEDGDASKPDTTDKKSARQDNTADEDTAEDTEPAADPAKDDSRNSKATPEESTENRDTVLPEDADEAEIAFRADCRQINYKTLLRAREDYLDTALMVEAEVVCQVDGGLFDENVYYLCVAEDKDGIERYYIVRDDRETDETLILEGDVVTVYGQLFGDCKVPAGLIATRPTVPAVSMLYCDLIEE